MVSFFEKLKEAFDLATDESMTDETMKALIEF